LYLVDHSESKWNQIKCELINSGLNLVSEGFYCPDTNTKEHISHTPEYKRVPKPNQYISARQITYKYKSAKVYK
jgi:hypothetical protein